MASYDIEITTDDTLELDAIIKAWNAKSNSIVNVTDGTEGTDFNLDGIQTNTAIFDPINSGIYNIDVNGQKLTVKVTDASTIPDGVVDNFNNTDSDRPGLYDSGDTVEKYYTNNGNDNDIVRSTTNAREGSHALSMENKNIDQPTVRSNPGDGLNQYPNPGDTVRWFAKDIGGKGITFLVHVEDSTPTNSFGFEVDAGNGGIAIFKYSDINTNQHSFTNLKENVTISISNDTWYWCEGDLASSSDPTLEMRIYNLKTDNTRGSLIGSVSTSVSDLLSARGIGLTTNGGVGGQSIDDIRIK